MSNKRSFIQLAHSGEWVPKVAAVQEAMTVHMHFAYNLGCMEDLSHLSAAYRSGDVDDYLKQMDDSLIERLIRKDYILGSLGSLASRLSLKANVACNMIVPEIDEGIISGYLIEPFVNRPILEDLHQAFQRNLEIRRQKAERDAR